MSNDAIGYTVTNKKTENRLLNRLPGEDGKQPVGTEYKQTITHPIGTDYAPLDSLTVHPANPRNHADTFAGIAVPSSVRARDMLKSIVTVGDIRTPLMVCGDNCASKRGTVLKGNRRLEACQLGASTGELPNVLLTRGVPVQYVDNLKGADEHNLINDHGESEPLRPTEAFKAMLKLQSIGYAADEIVFTYPRLLADYMGKRLDALPTEETERAKWYDKIRDTLAYNVLCWGLFPVQYLRDKVLAIQIEKEGMYSKDNPPPPFQFFKPTAQRTKELYKAYRADRKSSNWTKDGGPTFDALAVSIPLGRFSR
jgi:hypothetical protein